MTNQERIGRHLLAQWQVKNCPGCKFATKEKVGTGEPCCTYPGQIRQVGEICLERRKNRKK